MEDGSEMVAIVVDFIIQRVVLGRLFVGILVRVVHAAPSSA
jgi:hypothetical protein